MHSQCQYAGAPSCILSKHTYPSRHSDFSNDGPVSHQHWSFPGRVDAVWYDHTACAFDGSAPQPKIPRSGTTASGVHDPTLTLVVDVTHGPTLLCHTWTASWNIWYWRLPSTRTSHDEPDGAQTWRIRQPLYHRRETDP
jgi:hypothetical protein